MPPLADETTVRLTMILSGAVSLGAYEAGVVSQIAYALARWNEGRPDAPPLVVIDAISGASAGAMTGAMLAAHLMEGGDPAEFVLANKETWTGEALSFENQLRTDASDVHALLSTGNLDRISQQCFLPTRRDRARVRQAELIFTCTVTTLDPITYTFEALQEYDELQTGPSGRMRGVTHKDFATFSIARGETHTSITELRPKSTRHSEDAHAHEWSRVMAFAMASGAFPLAWQPMVIHRHAVDYPQPGLRRDGTYVRRRYTDGGLLNNMPLDRACEMLIDRADYDADEHRVFVLIQPDPQETATSRYTDTLAPAARDVETGPREIVAGLIDAWWEQSFQRDLHDTQDVNRRLRLRDRFLVDIIYESTNAVPLERLDEVLRDAREEIRVLLESRKVHATVDQALERFVARQPSNGKVRMRAAQLEAGARRQLFEVRMALSDFVADLHDKAPVRIGRIHPDTPLKGRMFEHFGGFIDASIMHHDFVCGLHDAHRWLRERLAQPHWPAPASAALDLGITSPDDVPETWEEIPADKRRRFIERLDARIADFIAEEMHPTRWKNAALHFVADRVTRALEQRAGL